MKKKLKLFFLILTIAFVTTGFKTPETNVSEHFVFTLENDTVVFPTNVPDFLDATNGSFGKIDPEMTMLAECQYYESNMMYRVSFFNPTEDTIDANEAVVKELFITPQTEDIMYIGDLRISYTDPTYVSDYVRILGEYDTVRSEVINNDSGTMYWTFNNYEVRIKLSNNYIINIVLTSLEDTLPDVSEKTWYDFKSGPIYRIKLYDTDNKTGRKYVISDFYATESKKETLVSEFVFTTGNATAAYLGYLHVGELDAYNIDKNIDDMTDLFVAKETERVLAETKNDINHFVISENVKNGIICVISFTFIIGIIWYERRKKSNK